MKVILLPFAGANKYSFTNFFKDENTVTLEYPGRGSRINEELLTDINDLVNDVFLQFQKEMTTSEDYIIYGHSLGALVGYLICQRIEVLNLKKPLKLVVSGRMAPQYPVAKILSDMPDDEFWEHIWKFGGTPSQIKEYPELIEMYTPILKADFKCVEDFKYQKNEKLTIPIDVLFGSTENITYNDVKAWEEETEDEVQIKELEGHHFFIYNHKDIFKELFKQVH